MSGLTVPAVEHAATGEILEQARTWSDAGNHISELAAQCRGLGMTEPEVWQGAAADAAHHRLSTALTQADSTGWAAGLCGTSTSGYARTLQVAQNILKALRWVDPMIRIDSAGVAHTEMPALLPLNGVLTGIAQSALTLVRAVDSATGTAVDALASHARPVPVVGWGDAEPGGAAVMPAQSINLPYGTATVVGDVAKADRVITLVGGVGSRGEAAKAKQVRFAQQLAGEKVAVVSWNGYHAPSNLISGASGELATTGGARLRAFQDSLRRINPDATLHVSGYSYGSVVVGQGAADGHLDADRVTFLGSPGVPVNHASELQINPGARVEAYTEPGDLIENISSAATVGKLAYDPAAVLPKNQGIHGADPTSPLFGADDLLNPGGNGERAGISQLLEYGIDRVDDARLATGGETGSHSAYYNDPAVVAALRE